MPEFTFHIKYEKGELFKFMMKAALPRVKHNKFFISVWLAGLLLTWFGWMYHGLSIIVMLFFLSLIPVVMLLTTLLVALSFVSYEYVNEMDIRFTEDKVFWQGKDFKSEAEWSYFKQYSENAVGFILMISNHRSLFLPKLIFENKDQMRQFREFVKSKLKESMISKIIGKEVLKQDG